MGKMEELYRAVDYRKANGNKAIDAASDYAVYDQLLYHIT
jgi:hypothetical protein